MDTRLDNLFALLAKDASPIARKIAAQQIGQIQQTNPQFLQNLLERVHVHLLSLHWDTRIAASQAIESICKYVPSWPPLETNFGLIVPSVKSEMDPNCAEFKSITTQLDPTPSIATKLESNPTLSVDQLHKQQLSESHLFWRQGRLSFDKVDFTKLMLSGKRLLGSSGAEYDRDFSILSKEQLAQQRKNIELLLGADLASSAYLSDEDLLGRQSLTLKTEPLATDQSLSDQYCAQPAGNDEIDISLHLKNLPSPTPSTRMQNKVKRRQQKDLQPLASKKFKSSPQQSPISSATIVDVDRAFEDSNEWPLERFSDELMNELFDHRWYIRHGAAIGLRPILKTHAQSAAKLANSSPAEQCESNEIWILDCVIRLLAVLVLDRFEDYAYDIPISPVRESCAQTLAVLFPLLTFNQLQQLFGTLETMWKDDSSWQVRHSAYLIFKYLVLIRPDYIKFHQDKCISQLLQGLADQHTNVQGAAASALQPLVSQKLGMTPITIQTIITLLIQSLDELDDLTGSTAFIMELISEICTLIGSYPTEFAPWREQSASNLIHLIPKCWPFFRYTLKSVRSSVVSTLKKIVSNNMDTRGDWLPVIFNNTMQLLFQNYVLELDLSIIDLTTETCIYLIDAASTVLIPFPSDQDPSQSLQNTSEDIAFNPIPPTLLDQTLTLELLYTWFNVFSTPENMPLKYDSFLHIGFDSGLDERPKLRSIDRREADLDMRLNLASILSEIALRGSDEIKNRFIFLLQVMVNGLSATERSNASLVVIQWAQKHAQFTTLDPRQSTFFSQLSTTFLAINESVTEVQLYAELEGQMLQMRNECSLLITSFYHSGVQFNLLTPLDQLSIAQAQELISITFPSLIQHVDQSKIDTVQNPIAGLEFLQATRARILTHLEYFERTQLLLNTRTKACIAAAIVAMQFFPEKLNNIIKPLMKSLKLENYERMQEITAYAIASLIYHCHLSHPVQCIRIIKNLIEVLISEVNQVEKIKIFSPVMSLIQMAQEIPVDCTTHPSAMIDHSSINTTITTSSGNTAIQTESNSTCENGRYLRGAEMTLRKITTIFHEALFDQLASFWQLISSPFAPTSTYTTLVQDQLPSFASSLLTIATITESLDPKLAPRLLALLPSISTHLVTPDFYLQALAAQAIAAIVKITAPASMSSLIVHVLSKLNHPIDCSARRGASLTLFCIVKIFDIDLLPYLIFFIIPILGRLSDQDTVVHRLASFNFGSLMKLMPLEAQVPNPPHMPESLVQQRLTEREFVDQLLGNRQLTNFEVPIKINTQLRPYQQDGVNWIHFLKKYNLHGILADDMGLGKTLQTLCVVLSDAYERKQVHTIEPTPDNQHIPALIICPPILVTHWLNEARRFCDYPFNIVIYHGSTEEKQLILNSNSVVDLLIMSYDALRKDIDWIEALPFNYCVLDEGHLIRNPKTKFAKAVHRIKANHRLILTGTPIQNNVLELWSLFDFLMPGLLGNERYFSQTYAKPVMQSNHPKATTAEQELGVRALETLHQQVLPFILRRMKENVLHDLPPKIIQDINLQLSPLQAQLYGEFTKHNAISGDEPSTHIFQALQYLRKLVSHPKLVLNANHPQFKTIVTKLLQTNASLDDIEHAPKLLALKELLNHCGIGLKKEYGVNFGHGDNPSGYHLTPVNHVVQSRVLVFAQLKSMLDIVECDLFKRHMPDVTYLRLDGSIPAHSRMTIVDQFNSNPSIDVLLLTVSVGGLGLNLTGANIVIFLEHDWNPQNDIQAMDRVHRIGQTKTVNVYRLITDGTLEQKIMNLQRFKLHVANTVVNKENQSFQNMDTSQIFDLFKMEESGKEHIRKEDGGERYVDEFGRVVNKDTGGAASGSKAGMRGLQGLLSSLEELDQDSKYDEEYNLDSFLASMKK